MAKYLEQGLDIRLVQQGNVFTCSVAMEKTRRRFKRWEGFGSLTPKHLAGATSILLPTCLYLPQDLCMEVLRASIHCQTPMCRTKPATASRSPLQLVNCPISSAKPQHPKSLTGLWSFVAACPSAESPSTTPGSSTSSPKPGPSYLPHPPRHPGHQASP